MNIFDVNFDEIIRIIVVGVFIYFFLILLLRVSGKRTLSKMNAFDFVITVALGSMFSNIIIDASITLIEGMTGIGLLILLQFIITKASMKYKAIGKIIKSKPALLYYNGEFIERNMIKERILKNEVKQSIRNAGYESYESISAVILETDGTLSVISSDGSLIHNLESISDSPIKK